MLPYQNAALPADKRATDLLSRLSLQEKIDQLTCDMVYENRYTADGTLDMAGRNTRAGNHRDPSHFAHTDRRRTAGECAALNNDLQRAVMAQSRWGIPALLHGEACHGGQFGDGTCFPQAIGLAAAWDTDLAERVYDAVAKEVRAVGVRQVLAPVINVCRDARWGRYQETFGEDPVLSGELGLAAVRAFEGSGVAATAKHFADNVGDGGRDSYASNTSWRTLRETFLPPFRRAIAEGRASAVMAAYNTLDGVPCHANAALLQRVLREEWGFQGIVVSDYGGVEGLAVNHGMARDFDAAAALALAAGVDCNLPHDNNRLRQLAEAGRLDMAAVDRAVLRVLRLKFKLGLFEQPFGDPAKADAVVRCPEHRALALEAAAKALVLLKNQNDVLPLSPDVKRLGVFGPAMDVLRLGSYTGAFLGSWAGDGAVTPLQGLRQVLGAQTEIVVQNNQETPAQTAAGCDAAVVFVTVKEDEGKDRNRCCLPGDDQKQVVDRGQGANIVVGGGHDLLPLGDQEGLILDLAATGVPVVVVLLSGSAVTMERWADKVASILQAWYPGEQGGLAIAQALFGITNPGGRLPMTFPRNMGQMPLYYNHKPSGRGYGYLDDDGQPAFAFGHGLSYSTFAYDNLALPAAPVSSAEIVTVSLEVINTSERIGDEVVQLYIRRRWASVATPVKELKGFRRITLQPGEGRAVRFALTPEDLSLWDREMNFINEPGDVLVMAGASSADIRLQGSFQIVDTK